MKKARLKPSHMTQFLKNGFISDGSVPSSIMAMGSCVIGKIRRSLLTHCRRRIDMMQIIDRNSDRANGSQ